MADEKPQIVFGVDFGSTGAQSVVATLSYHDGAAWVVCDDLARSSPQEERERIARWVETRLHGGFRGTRAFVNRAACVRWRDMTPEQRAAHREHRRDVENDATGELAAVDAIRAEVLQRLQR